jgi:hypothetical protein
MGGQTGRTGAYQERLCNILHKSTSYKYGGELNNKSVVCAAIVTDVNHLLASFSSAGQQNQLGSTTLESTR